MDFGGITLAIAVLGVVGWLTFLVTQSRVRRRREAAPQNLSPYMTDDELENTRLSRILVAALVASAVMAIVMPVYYLNEVHRQEAAAEKFDEIAIERGHEWFINFQCGNCHGADAGGGAASFVEARSGITTTWAAPSLNDVLYRYDESEVLYWLNYGRPGSPMPAWGAPGGGPMGTQELDELIAYLSSIQISQADAIAAVDGKVNRELSRLDGAAASVEAVTATLQTDLERITAAPARYTAAAGLPAELETLLSGPGTCTKETAAAVALGCSSPAPDADRDGVGDVVELQIGGLIDLLLQSTPDISPGRTTLQKISFDPQNAFTTSIGPTPVPDLDQIPHVIDAFVSIVRDLKLTVDTGDTLTATVTNGLAFVEDASQRQAWAIDFEAIAAAGFDGNVEQAQRGAALYNAYCARCHTAGYSAGVVFTQEAGSGALGPSLRDGRSAIQFPDEAEHLTFITNGSVNGQAYGVNGIGRGWMPGFGTVLSEEDLMLIVKFERAL